MLLSASGGALAGQLPIPCAGGLCGATGPTTWIGSGNATATQQGNQLTVNQTSSSALLNWSSFNISAGNKVQFNQPSSSSTAINRIFQANPSQILGSLNANGYVYLLNQNGILFGAGSQVNVGGLVASSLDISPAALSGGIAQAANTEQPAFQPFANGLPSGPIKVQSGATITANGGQVLVFAPSVENDGLIQTPDGQTILGAGQRIFLLADTTDTNVRGLLIQVGDGGTVTNGGTANGLTPSSLGQIVADRGNVTLAGLAVNQNGRISATTTVRENGSIYLQAQDTSSPTLKGKDVISTVVERQGALTFGAGSTTSVSLEGGPSDTTVDANAQPPSLIEATAQNIAVLDHATISAPGGQVALTATVQPSTIGRPALSDLGAPDAARVSIASTAVIDVSGATDSLPVSDNSLAVQLRATELEDNPANRNGPLHGDTVYVDLRAHGTNPDGTTWIGTPIADLSGDVAAIQYDVFERNLPGGTINIGSSGSVLVGKGATLNVSGGQIDWQAGYVKSSILLGANGKAYNIASADPNMTYLGTLDSLTVADPRWGTSTTLALPGYNPQGQYQAAYVQGADAGTVAINAPKIALDGNIVANTVTGPLQQQPTAALTAGEVRPSDQVPLGGTLVLGNENAIKDLADQTEGLLSVQFQPGFALDGMTGPTGAPFNIEYDPLPAGFVTTLRPDLLGPGGVAHLTIAAEGQITLPAGTTLDPGAGGSVDLEAGRVLDNGSIIAPSGSITLVAAPTALFNATANNLPTPGLFLNSGAQLVVAGTWVNDELAAGSQLLPLWTAGGSIDLNATAASLAVPQGVLLDASAGAQVTNTGKVSGGSGGSITVTSNPSGVDSDPSFVAVFDPTLRGYALSSGGKLSVALPTICVSSVACSNPRAIQLEPSLLTDDGFASVALTSQSDGLTIESDVDLTVRQENLNLLPGYVTSPSGTPFESLTTVTTLPAYVRQPENLALNANTEFTGITSNAALTIAQGAQLSFDPQAVVTLSTDFRILANGVIRDPAGDVTLAVTSDVSAPGFRPYQGIWLGPSSLIDVSGVTQLTPNNMGLLLGSVLPGGSISLNAQHGYLDELPGSSLAASGTAAQLDIPTVTHTSGGYSLQDIASSGGSISLFAAEGLFADGALDAHAGGAGAAGGTLSVALDGSFGTGGREEATNPYPQTPRVLDITATESPIVTGEGLAVAGSLDGTGRIAASTINAGGFDDIELVSRDLRYVADGAQTVPAIGAVQFEPGVILSPTAQLVIDAPEIRAVGSGVVSLSAGYVALGSSDALIQQVSPASASGAATLNVSGGFVDLVGNFDLQGFGNATIVSSSDIRAVGVITGGAAPAGMLATGGNLTLAAQQIYPSTLTSYAVHLTGSDPAATLSILAEPGTADDVLSAGGALLLQAPSIVDSGTVRAPFGSISLVGGIVTSTNLNGTITASSNGNVTLAPGSLLSVSANGLTIPFGTTQAGQDWVYPIQQAGQGTTGIYLVYGTGAGQLAPPQKTVSISAGELGFENGAKIDLSGGGDMLAYEWIPGTGGTTDYLDAQTSPNTFAVLPGYRLPVAPLDPLADTGFTLQPGDSVYLAGGGGLTAGTYTLLPPRYALLPGAFLVTQVNGFSDLTPGQQLPQLDGSTIVAGRRVNGATGLGDTRTSGFDVAPGTLAQTQAQYTTTSANSFFESQAQTNAAQASMNGSTVAPVVPQLPEDAGALSIQVSRSLVLSGTLTAPAAVGGRGSSLDLSAPNLVVGAPTANTPAGAVSVDPQQLDSLGADSILLGGVRTFVAGTTDVNVNSSNVEVGDGVSLTAPEVILVASNSVTLDSGALVKATGTTLTTAESLEVPGGAALLRVSTGPQAQVSAPPPPASGSSPAPLAGIVTVADGATVSAPGSLLVQGGAAVDFSGDIDAAGAAVRLGSGEIAIGDAPSDFVGLAIRAPLIAGLTGADLELDTPNAVQIFGSVDLTLGQLTLNSFGLSAATVDSALTVTAKQVALLNTYTQGQSGTVAAGGGVNMSAGSVDLGPGSFALNGFGKTQIGATQDMSVTGDGALSATGDLLLNAGVFQSTGAFNYAVTAAGHLGTASTAPVAPTSASAAGGAWAFTASDVSLGGTFVLPSGELSAESTGAGALTQVAAGAMLGLGGRSVAFDGDVVSSPGGSLSLTSDTGSITIDPSAVLDVSAGSGSASGGSLALSAPEGGITLGGTLRGAGGANFPGASLTVDAQSFDFANLSSKASAGGLSGNWDVHLRGAGDLVVAAGDQLVASSVTLTADQGSVRVLGGIDVSSDLGGDIGLIAQQNVEVAGSLTTTALASADRGGSITLESSNGGVFVDSGALLTLGGRASADSPLQDAGSVYIRAPRNSVLSVVTPGATPMLTLDGTIKGATQITLEGYQGYQSTATGPVATGGVIGPNDVTAGSANPLWNDASNFVTAASGVAQALGHGIADPRVQVIPGIEIDAAGNLTVGTTFDLSTWRFGANSDVVGALTLRAAGNLNINASITDGFSSLDPGNPTAAYALPFTPGPSWSYRLTAGADLSSANPLAVLPASQILSGGGSVSLAPGTPSNANGVQSPIMVRTGTGNIDIAAAQDLVLGNQASVIYTAGEAAPTGTILDELNDVPYPINGGSIDVYTGRNVVGATSNELFTDWLWRAGSQASSLFGYVPTAWSIEFDRFEQGIGALGGGDVTVRAGGNISDLGAVVPSIGLPSADGTTELNSGVLTVQAGGNILGGKFLDMAGSATLTAGGGLSAGSLQATTNPKQPVALNPVLAMGDSQFVVNSRRDITLEGVVDPTLLPQSNAQVPNFANYATYFSTYDDQSSVSIQSAGGAVTLVNTNGPSSQTPQSALAVSSPNVAFNISPYGAGSNTSLRTYAPTLDVAALGGNVNVEGSMDLWPSADGNLNLLATGGVTIATPTGTGAIHVILSDADPLTTLPNVTTPSSDLQSLVNSLDTIPASAANLQGFFAPEPVHGGAFAADSQPDTVPARIVGLTGDVTLQPADAIDNSQLFFAKPVDITAGLDIVDLGALIEQFSPENVSTISAGRDFIYPTPRTAAGQLQTNTRFVEVNGPGQLAISAGRDVNLGTSGGITTVGNLLDPALPVGGANITVTAGVSGPPPGDAAFISKYLGADSTYGPELVQYMETVTGMQDLTAASALSLFQQLSPDQQQGLIDEIFFSELRAGGRYAAQSGAAHDNFTQAFNALESLFPGSNPDLSQGQTVGYTGDIDLYFSEIYTVSGGNINLLAPGGQINVGLATPPAAFGVTKQPYQLGIVAQGVGSVSAVSYGDEEVNQSRIFAANGGNILLWSTEGNIDAGRGSKSAISAPPPTVSYDENGVPSFVTPPALTGSGIQALTETPGAIAGDVDLFAPHGVVNANDAGIVAGNLTIAATAVLGTNNITVTGTAVGIPIAVTGLGLSAAAAGSSTAAATNSAQTSVADNNREKPSQTPVSDSAMGWLDVFVLGYGEEQCAADNLDCLKRQQTK